MCALTSYEQETILNFNEGDTIASIYTHNKAMRRKLERLVNERPKDCSLYQVSRDGRAAEFHIPKSWIRINPPRKAALLSDEQKRQRREQLAKIRKT